MLLLVALSAIIAPFVFVVILRMSALKGMFFSAIIVIALAFTTWGMEGNVILASILQGTHKAMPRMYR